MCNFPLLPFPPFYFPLRLEFLIQKEKPLIFGVLWKTFFPSFLFWNLKFSFEKWNPLFLDILENFSLFLQRLIFSWNWYHLFYFLGNPWEVFFFSQSNMSWLNNSFGVLIGGGGGWIFWPPFFIIIIFYFFFFTLSSCSIVTIHKHLPFAFSSFPHLSCLENYFSRLPNLISSISQNIFSNLWIIDHICKSFFFLNPFSNFHLCTFMASPRRPTFLLSMGRNIIHP